MIYSRFSKSFSFAPYLQVQGVLSRCRNRAKIVKHLASTLRSIPSTAFDVIISAAAALLAVSVSFSFEAKAKSSECKEPLDRSELSINGTLNFVLRHKIKSVDELLPCLPEEMHSPYRYMLAFKSFSPQGSSHLQPRLLMVATTPHAKEPSRKRMVLAATVGAHPQFSHNQSFEMAESDLSKPPGQRLRFARIDFLQSPPVLKSAECAMCHGPTPRIVMDSYPKWTGFYGEDQNQCSMPDRAAFDQFRAQINGTRYRHLKGLDQLYGHFGNDTSKCVVISNQTVHDTLLFESTERAAALMKASPDFERYKFAVFAATLNCPDTVTFLPKEVRKYHRQTQFLLPEMRNVSGAKEAFKKLSDFYSKQSQGFGPFESFKKLAFADFDGQFFWDSMLRMQQEAGRDLGFRLGRVRYLLEGRGYSMLEWSPSRDLGHYRDASGFQTGLEYSAALQDLDSELAVLPIKPPMSNNGENYSRFNKELLPGICADLKEKSLKSLAGLIPKTLPPRPLKYPKAFAKCASCHSESPTASWANGPAIPFGSEVKMQSEVFKNLLGRKIAFRIRPEAGALRMPPLEEPELSKKERAEIEAYLQTLGFDIAP